MRTKTIILFWAMLMLTAILVGIGFIYLMRHERDRMESSWKRTATREAELLSSDLCKAVLDVETAIGQRLRQITLPNPEKELSEWVRREPLIRNVFVWRSGGLVYPNEEQGLAPEDTRFRQRYAPLFDGRRPWRAPLQNEMQSASDPGQSPRTETSRIKLLAARSIQSRTAVAEARDAREEQDVVWKPWFSGEDLFIIGYIIRNDGDLVYGVELESAALLSRLIAIFESDAGPGFGFVLEDSHGSPVHMTGTADPHRETPIDGVSLTPVLPNWQIKVYGSGGAVGPNGKSVLAVSVALGLILVLSIVACGSMLFWLARRNMLDAARKTSFVSNVSHELKTPLTTIRMYAEMLGEKRVADSDKREHYLRVIIEQSHRLTRLVNNVLDFSRLEQRRKQYTIETFDIFAETRTIIEAQRPRIEKTGMRLNIDLPADPCQRRLDRDVLEQALLNLIDNAIKYAGTGGDLTVAWDGSGRIEICDRGPGIPPPQRKRIFQSYHRIDDSLTANQAGCGLGLTIARQLLRGLGGDLVFTPREGGGACFAIVLPKDMKGTQ